MVILLKTPLPRALSSGIGAPLAAEASVAVTTITYAVGGIAVGGTSVGACVGGTGEGTSVGTSVGEGISVGALASVGVLAGTNTVTTIGVGCSC